MSARQLFLAMGMALGLTVTVGLSGALPALAGGQEDPGPVDSNPDPGDTSIPEDTAPTGTDEPGSDTPLPGQDPTAQPTTTLAGSPVPTLPPGCDPPPAPAVVFVGRFAETDGDVARFRVDAIRSDPGARAFIGRYLDVEIGDDLRFLDLDREYLVAAEATEGGGAARLRSKVKRPPPLFGGDQVVGVDDPSLECPDLLDPIVVRRADGGAVDTGVFSGFLGDKKGIGLAFLKPAGAVAAVLVGLVAVKYLLIGVYKGIVTVARRLRRCRAVRAARRALAATMGS